MVIGIQSGIFQFLRLTIGEHSERATDFKAHRVYAPHHVEYFVEIAVIADFAPGRTHTKPRTTRFFGSVGRVEHVIHLHQFMNFHVSMVAGGLWAVSTIFGATACFDRQQRTNLHLLRVVVLAVNGGGLINQVENG